MAEAPPRGSGGEAPPRGSGGGGGGDGSRRGGGGSPGDNYGPKKPLRTHVYTQVVARNKSPWGIGFDGNGGDTGGSQASREATVTAANGPIPVIYGVQRVGGRIFYVNTANGFLYVGVAFCEGPVNSFVSANISLDGYPLSTCLSNLWIYQANLHDGAYAQTVDSMLSSVFGYTQTHPGLVYAVFRISATDTLPFNGVPSVLAVIGGLLVYDPRTTTTAFSDNNALVARDMMTRFGGLVTADFDDTSVNAAANYFDTATDSEKLYTINLAIVNPSNLRAWLNNVRMHCGLDIFMDQGVFVFAPDKTLSSPTALDDTMFRDMAISRKSSVDIPTRVRVNWTNVSKDYIDDVATAETDAVAAGTEDAVESSVDCQGITSIKMAQRHALYLLRKANYSNLLISCVMSAKAEQLQRGQYVTITHLATAARASSPAYRLSAQGAIVREIAPAGNGEFNVAFEEYDANSYSTNAYTTDTPPSTTLPPYVYGAPAEVTCPVLASTGVVTWRAPRVYGTGLVPTSPSYGVWQVDVGVGSTALMGRLKVYCVNNGGPTNITSIQWSDNGSTWTAVDHATTWYGRSPVRTYYSTVNIVEWWYIDWDTPAAPHRYWRVLFGGSALSPIDTSAFLPIANEVDQTVTGYEIHNSNIPVGVNPSGSDPIFLAGGPATVSADLTGMVLFNGYPLCTPTIVAVRQIGGKSAGVTLNEQDISGATAVGLQSGALTVQSGTTDISGTQKAGVTESPVVLIPEGTAPSAVSGKTVLYADSTGHRLRESNNGGSFYDVTDYSDWSQGSQGSSTGANKLVQRDANGHVIGNYGLFGYVNTPADNQGMAQMTKVAGRGGDNYIRWYDPVINYPTNQISLSNGANQNVTWPTGASFCILVTPTAAFSIGGIVAPVAPLRIVIKNHTGYTFTLNHEDTGSTAANRIYTRTGANVTIGNFTSCVTLFYDFFLYRWVIESLTNY